MKPSFVRLSQYLIAFSLIFGWIYFQITTNDKKIFIDIHYHLGKRTVASSMLARNNSRLVDYAIYATERRQNLKFITSKIEEVQDVFGKLQDNLKDKYNQLYRINDEQVNDEIIFPMDFNKTARVKGFIRNGELDKFSKYVENTFYGLDSSILFLNSGTQLSKKQLDEYHQQKQLLLENKSQ